MLNVVKQKDKIEMIGDFTSDDLNELSEYFVKVDKNHRSNSLSLSYLSVNPLNRLENIVSQEFIDKLFKSSEYDCPINGYTHKSILPFAILTDNPKDYIKMYHSKESSSKLPWYTEMACDPDYNKSYDIDQYYYMSSIEYTFLGPGYTDYCYINDGSSDISRVGIELENGDIILFALREWYNK